MSIDKIKDISKLRTMLKSALGELEYIKDCCISTGKELEKHSFAWDGKEKNLVVQAAELNKKYEQFRQALEKIKEIALQQKARIQFLSKGYNSDPIMIDIIGIINEVLND